MYLLIAYSEKLHSIQNCGASDSGVIPFKTEKKIGTCILVQTN
jgi:hypothetical protein